MNDSAQQKDASNGVVPSAMVRRAEEYVETFCSLTDNTCGEVSTRFHAAVLHAEVKRLRAAIAKAVDQHERIRWGWDGDCGSNNIIAILEDALSPNTADEQRRGHDNAN